MKILLSSSGLSSQKLKDFLAERFGSMEGKKALLIYTIDSEDDYQWLEHYDAELKSVGLQYDGRNISEDKKISNLPEYDIYYVCGGNTFHILDRMRKTGLDKIIIEESGMGKLYFGVSAGSIIAGPDIEIAALGDLNDINLKDLTGLNLTDLIITPHYQNREEKDIVDFEERRRVKAERIKDGEAIFVIDEKSSMIF